MNLRIWGMESVCPLRCASGNIHCSPCWFSCNSCASGMSKTAVSFLQHRSIFRNNSCFQKGLLRQYDSNILSLQKSPDYRQEIMRRASVGNTDVGAIGENIKGPKMKDRGLALPKKLVHTFLYFSILDIAIPGIKPQDQEGGRKVSSGYT